MHTETNSLFDAAETPSLKELVAAVRTAHVKNREAPEPTYKTLLTAVIEAAQASNTPASPNEGVGPRSPPDNEQFLNLIRQRSRDLLDEKAAADFLDLKPGTLSVWRSTGRYAIPFVKVGHRVRYRRADLEAWLDSRTRQNGETA